MRVANSFNGIVATFEKSNSRERLGVTLHVCFFNLALAGGESLALIRSQQIQRCGRAPIFIKRQLPGFSACMPFPRQAPVSWNPVTYASTESHSECRQYHTDTSKYRIQNFTQGSKKFSSTITVLTRR